jgi:hypothetical protein
MEENCDRMSQSTIVLSVAGNVNQTEMTQRLIL